MLEEIMRRPNDLTIILAAGKSTRISQLSFDRPKTLLSVGAQSLLGRLCLMFAEVSRQIVVVAGRNREPIEAHLADLALDIKVLGDDRLTELGSAASLAAGLRWSGGGYSSCHILESDIILSEAALERYLSGVAPVRTVMVPIVDLASDDKLFQMPGQNTTHIAKTPPLRARILGKFLGATCVPHKFLAPLVSVVANECKDSYVNFLSSAAPNGIDVIALDEGMAAEVDTGPDYRRVLLDPVLGKRIRRSRALFKQRGHLSLVGPLKRLIGVYDVFGALLTARSGFDGLWLGSFQIALCSGSRDDASYNPFTALALADQIQARGNTLPIVVDAANGLASHAQTASFIERALAARVAAICVDDNDSDRVCSLYSSGGRKMVSPRAFEKRIRRLATLTSGRMHVIARTEALVIGHPYAEAAQRLKLAVNAGATAVLPHYVGGDPSIIRGFLRKHPFTCPVLLVPTGLMTLPVSEFKQMGCNAVVYANLDLRLRFRRLTHLYARLGSEAALSEDTTRELADPKQMKATLDDD